MRINFLTKVMAVALVTFSVNAFADQCSVADYVIYKSTTVDSDGYNAYPFNGSLAQCQAIRNGYMQSICANYPGFSVLEGFLYVDNQGNILANQWRTVTCKGGVIR